MLKGVGAAEGGYDKVDPELVLVVVVVSYVDSCRRGGRTGGSGMLDAIVKRWMGGMSYAMERDKRGEGDEEGVNNQRRPPFHPTCQGQSLPKPSIKPQHPSSILLDRQTTGWSI